MLKAVRACACRLSVNKHANEGFTLVELMIALSVLSTILVTASLVMIQVGKLYVKGVNASDLQNVNRNVVTDITSAIQFSGDKPIACAPNAATGLTCPDAHGVNSFCIGTTRYNYIIGKEQGTDQGLSPPVTTDHVLWRDTIPGNGSCQPFDILPGTNGYDMLADHMRLTQFTITEGPTNVYTVQASMAFGDSDLLSADQLSCRGDVGNQFCSTSTITSTVTRRVVQ